MACFQLKQTHHLSATGMVRALEVDKSRLRFCNGTLLMDPVEMGIYAEMTGDLDGVVFEGPWFVGECRLSVTSWTMHIHMPCIKMATAMDHVCS